MKIIEGPRRSWALYRIRKYVGQYLSGQLKALAAELEWNPYEYFLDRSKIDNFIITKIIEGVSKRLPYLSESCQTFDYPFPYYYNMSEKFINAIIKHNAPDFKNVDKDISCYLEIVKDAVKVAKACFEEFAIKPSKK